MDADLQDPPELIKAALEKLDQGFDVVYGVRRRRKEPLPQRFAYAAFYRLLRLVSHEEIPLDAGDFCVITRRVAQMLSNMPERNLFLRGLRAWTGFRQFGLEYEGSPRSKGKSSYSLRKLLLLALDGLLSVKRVNRLIGKHERAVRPQSRDFF